MIIEFSVENYRSIQTLQTLHLAARPLREVHAWLDANVAEGDGAEAGSTGGVGLGMAGSAYHNEVLPNLGRLPAGVRVLKTKAIYGPNAGGKSNLIRAMGCFVAIVGRSVPDEKILNLIEPFALNEATAQAPTFFQQVFVMDGVVYRYGFEATRERIVSEWLFGKPGKREVKFFTRDAEGLQVNKHQFGEGKKLAVLQEEANELLRTNSLFLGVSAALNVSLARRLVVALTSTILIRSEHLIDVDLKEVVYQRLQNEGMRKRVVAFLQAAGLDIQDVAVKKVQTQGKLPPDPNVPAWLQSLAAGTLLLVSKKRYDNTGQPLQEPWVAPFEHTESQGSQKLLQLAPFILEALEQGRTLVVDEFEASLHTELAQAVLKLFHSAENNPRHAQFIFATHDTNLLNSLFLRRDQIDFVEKNAVGASELYSLADYTGVRNDENYEKSYLGGRYGALPEVGDLRGRLEQLYPMADEGVFFKI